jgi:hypothetical protein
MAPPRPATFHRSSKFDSYYKALDKPIRETVDKVLAALAVNCAADWLNGRKMVGYQDKWRWWVNGQYRIVADKRKDVEEFDLEFVGTKNEFKKKYG